MSQESKTIWLIVPSENHTLVLRVAGNEVAPFTVVPKDSTTLAQAIIKILQEQEYDAQPILLAPRSSEVLAVMLPPTSTTHLISYALKGEALRCIT